MRMIAAALLLTAVAEGAVAQAAAPTADASLREAVGVSVVAISRTGAVISNPGPDVIFVPGDRVAVIGEPDGTTTRNYLGRSAYPGDLSFKGKIRDFRLYDRVLTDPEIDSDDKELIRNRLLPRCHSHLAALERMIEAVKK